MASAAVEVNYYLAGVLFYYPNPHEIRVYKDGQFYSLPEAYNQGMLSQENLRDIQSFHQIQEKKSGMYSYYIEKSYCTATLDDDFSDHVVIITLNYLAGYYAEPQFIEFVYSDFEFISYGAGDKKIFKLTLSEHSKEEVLSVIKLLEKRDDIFSAEPE